MTLLEAKEKLLKVANAELNYHEGYNNYIKYAEGSWDNQFYGWDLQHQPWCDVFVDWCFCTAFGLQTGAAMTYQTVGSGSALCSASLNFYRNHGAYYDYPEVGDQIFFQNNGQISHTGIVETVNGSGINWISLTTIEGNSSDQVAKRTYYKGNNYIAGFGRPKWSLVTNENNSTTPIQNNPISNIINSTSSFISNIQKQYHSHIYNVKINLLKENDYGPQVASLQALLNGKGFKCDINSKFDKQTIEALKKFQTAANIEADGEFGGATFNAIWNYTQSKE